MLIGEAEEHLSRSFFSSEGPLSAYSATSGLLLILAIASPLHRQHQDLAPLPTSENEAVEPNATL